MLRLKKLFFSSQCSKLPNNNTNASWTPELSVMLVLLLFFKLLFFGNFTLFSSLFFFSPGDTPHSGKLPFNKVSHAVADHFGFAASQCATLHK